MRMRSRIERLEARIGTVRNPQPRSSEEWSDFSRWETWVVDRRVRQIMFLVRAHGTEQGADECLGQAYCRAIGADWNEFLRSLKERRAAHQPGEEYARWRADTKWAEIRDSWQPQNDQEVRAEIAALSMVQAAELAGMGRHQSYR